jgi:hypothetical protein
LPESCCRTEGRGDNGRRSRQPAIYLSTVVPFYPLNVGERVFGVIPIGYGEKGWSFTERLLTGFGRTHRRKALGELLTDTRENDFSPWARAALEAGRLAPSAFNRQPWRFSTSRDSITISVVNNGSDRGMSRRVDCGIAMLHVELGALSEGVTGRWELLPDPQVARFTVVR